MKVPAQLVINPSDVTAVTGSPLNDVISVSGEDALDLHVWLHTQMFALRYDTSGNIMTFLKQTSDSAERNRLMWLLSNHSPSNEKSFHEALQNYEQPW